MEYSPGMTLVYPVASGKGGVGKTVFTANLGVALAQRRKTVVVVDLDLGGSNLHTCYGIKNRHSGLGAFVYRKESSLAALLVETGIDRLHLIPGDGLIPGTANMPYFIKARILEGLAGLSADYVLLDLGAGSSNNIIDFFIQWPSGILVAAPEATSILNAYSFLKTALFRLLLRSFPEKSQERKLILDFIANRIEGTASSYQDLVKSLADVSPESGARAESRIKGVFPKVILNLVHGRSDLPVAGKLREMARKHLSMDVEYLGVLPWDDAVRQSVRARAPLLCGHPDSPFGRGIQRVADRLLMLKEAETPLLFAPDEDLETLSAEAPQG
jgi:flagellar biosynthesis protein FlhG